MQGAALPPWPKGPGFRAEYLMSGPGKDEIVRYPPGIRINHWIVALSFVLLALSGLALFHPAMFWLTAMFGGGPWTRILHPFIGVFMAALFFLLGRTMWQ